MTEQACCPPDWRLFLPRAGTTPPIGGPCHLPGQVRHRPKWQLALDMLDELDQWALGPPVLVADAGYREQVRPTAAPYAGRGHRPQPRYRDQPWSLKQLALQAGQQAGVELIWRRAARACNAPGS